MKAIRIVLAEDHHVVRAAIATFLQSEKDIEVVGQVEQGAGILEAVETHRPDVLLLDAHMPGHRVIDTARRLKKSQPGIKILVLSAYDRREYVVGLLGAGASGYVLKDDPPATLAEAIRATAKGLRWLSPRVADVLVRSAAEEDDVLREELTQREGEVLQLMATGSRNDRIARELSISEQTVKNHVRSIFGKLGVATRVEAVLYAIHQGWVETKDSLP